MTVLVQYWFKPVMQGHKYILYLSISTILSYSCHATSEIHPAWQYWCNTEVNLLCRIKNTSCSAVSAQHWGNPVMQHQKFTLYDSIGAILSWTCHARSKIHPVPQYQYNTEWILSCNIRNSPCMTVLTQYWAEPVMQGQKCILFLSINAILS